MQMQSYLSRWHRERTVKPEQTPCITDIFCEYFPSLHYSNHGLSLITCLQKDQVALDSSRHPGEKRLPCYCLILLLIIQSQGKIPILERPHPFRWPGKWKTKEMIAHYLVFHRKMQSIKMQEGCRIFFRIPLPSHHALKYCKVCNKIVMH